MATSTDIKNRATALSQKTDSNSITPEEVGGLFYDTADLCEAAIRNGGTLGIRKVYTSISAMEADSTAPTDLWGNPMRRGSLCVIYDSANPGGAGSGDVYAWQDPGWMLAGNISDTLALQKLYETMRGLVRGEGDAADGQRGPYKWLGELADMAAVQAALDGLHVADAADMGANAGVFRGSRTGTLFYVENIPLDYAADRWAQSLRGNFAPDVAGTGLLSSTEYHVLWRVRKDGEWGAWKRLHAGRPGAAPGAEVFNNYEGGNAATGGNSHAEGNGSQAVGDTSHAEGKDTVAGGTSSHAEGQAAHAGGTASHAEGGLSEAAGDNSHAEGYDTSASGRQSHAEGYTTRAQGDNSHAEGENTKASGDNSHAEGYYTKATNSYEHAEGSYNASHTGTRHSIGIGTSSTDRKNAVEAMDDGRVFVHGIGGYDGTNPDGAKTLKEAVEGITGLDDYPAFSTTKAYAAGDVVRYGGMLYKFTADHAAGVWTGTDVEETDVVKAHIMQELGDSETAAMSQKVVTDSINTINDKNNGQYRFANTFKEESIEHDYSQSGLINTSGNNVIYGGHFTYCYKCSPGDAFTITHTSYSKNKTGVLFVTIYRIPQGERPTRDYLVTDNLLETIEKGREGYSLQDKEISIGDYSPHTQGYDLYLCIVYYDGTSGTDSLEVKRRIPQAGFLVEQQRINEEQGEINKEIDKIPTLDLTINGGYGYVDADFDGSITGATDSSGNNVIYGNHYTYYKKVNNGERLRYSHTSTSSGNNLTYGFYQLPVGEVPARANIITDNLLEPKNTSNATLVDEEITAPSVSGKDLYFVATLRMPPSGGGDTYSLSIYGEILGYEERIKALEDKDYTKRPFEGKGVYFAGDSNTMHFLYKDKFLETTGMNLIGYTSTRGNGATSTALYGIVKSLDEEGSIDWAKIDIFGIFVGGNDYDHDVQAGTFETSYDEDSPTTRYSAIRMLIEYCQQKAMDANNKTMIIVAFSRPERDDYKTTGVAMTTNLLENVEYVLYSGQPKNAVSEDFPDLTGIGVAQYGNDETFEKALLAPQKGESKTYSSERVEVDEGKKIRISARSSSNFHPSFEVHYIGGGSETITKESTDKIDSSLQWILSDGTEVTTDNYYHGRRNGAHCTMADIGNQILDCARRMGCPACDLHSLSGVTYKNLRYWIPDGTHYGQKLGDRLGVLMGNFINYLVL